ncbi:hypothetical protein ACJRO7_034117 [Eucalyptus globulus]|uniref:Uncharacterized protein n=1 Tax=Eucalyptus globulus TaxID=34317 RepID=A0ABD3J2N3_EUCGL
MSIEALAMAGVDHAKCGIEWQDFDADADPPPLHLLDEENDASDSIADAQGNRQRSSGIDEDRRMKLKMLGWAKYVAFMYGIALEFERKEGRPR